MVISNSSREKEKGLKGTFCVCVCLCVYKKIQTCYLDIFFTHNYITETKFYNLKTFVKTLNKTPYSFKRLKVIFLSRNLACPVLYQLQTTFNSFLVFERLVKQLEGQQ